MKNHFWKNLGAIVLLAVIALFTTQCQTEVAGINNDELADEVLELRSESALSTQQGLCECLTTNYEYQELSAHETDAILLMREEEKFARDIYLQLGELWGYRIFNNIAKAEQKHFEVMGCLLQKYELIDPADDNDIGVFTNQDLQALHNTLLEQGTQSYANALIVGATIEDLDIADLMNLSAAIDNDDITAVFEELTKGSRNHLRAFTKQLSFQDIAYEAQYISEELLAEIVNTPTERGGSLCFSNGNGGFGGHGHNNNTGGCPYDNEGMGPHGNGGNGNNGDCPNGGNGGNGNNGDCPNGGNGGNGNNGDCPNGSNGGNGNGGNGNGGNGNGGNG